MALIPIKIVGGDTCRGRRFSAKSMLASLWLALLAVFIVTPLLAADGELPVAYSGRIAGDEHSTRFILDFDREISIHTFYMDNPRRIVIDLAQSVFSLDDTNPVSPRGLVSFLRFGTIANGRSRIVLSLAGPAEITAKQVKPHTGDAGYRMILDLAATDKGRYAALSIARDNISAITADNAPANKPVPRDTKSGRFVIVIDPGHGGIDGGAIGFAGTLEKNLTLSFATIFADKLRRAGSFDVEMTRSEDVFVSLKQRVARGQDIDADLFISIHADTLAQRDVRGSTVYTLSKKASDRLSEKLAQSENSVDLVAGLSLPEESEVITDILVDLTTRETKQFSRRFSTILVKNLENRIKLIHNPQRSAAFGVLKAPKVPSILFELGYLSNAEDEKLLGSRQWQLKVADALTLSVVAFFKPRL